jgi:hypothetical protein
MPELCISSCTTDQYRSSGFMHSGFVKKEGGRKQGRKEGRKRATREGRVAAP